MGRRRRLPDLADDQRCTRNGTKWRCHLPRLPNKCFCPKHHALNLARSQSKSKSRSESKLLTGSEPEPATAIASDQSQSQTLVPFQTPKFKHRPLREIWAFARSPEDRQHLVYARVDRLVPAQPLVEVTPLVPVPDPTADVACGLFQVGDCTETMDMGLFSHRVCFEIEEVVSEGGDEDGDGGVVSIYKIYPKKGEIWAVEGYGWVEVVSGFGEGEGACGAVLVEDGEKEEEEEEEEEREGLRFRRRLHEGCELIRRFSIEEVGMFLHRVSSARVAGRGGQGASEVMYFALVVWFIL